MATECNNNGREVGPSGRGEPLPAAPPVLEREPIVRLMHQRGFEEVDYSPEKRVPVNLTNAEIRTLAQHHLDRACYIVGYIRSGGGCGSTDIHRSIYHEDRFLDLRGLLAEADQKAFDEIVAIRNDYLDTLDKARNRRGSRGGYGESHRR
jgi:hypothetical protein